MPSALTLAPSRLGSLQCSVKQILAFLYLSSTAAPSSFPKELKQNGPTM